MVYAPTAGSSDEDINLIYDTIEKVMSQCKSQEVVIVMGDLNAKVGKEKENGLGNMDLEHEMNEEKDGVQPMTRL